MRIISSKRNGNSFGGAVAWQLLYHLETVIITGGGSVDNSTNHKLLIFFRSSFGQAWFVIADWRSNLTCHEELDQFEKTIVRYRVPNDPANTK